MIQTVRKAWGIPELRKKILFTLLVLVIYRIGSAIAVPYVNTDMLEQYLDSMGTTILGLYNVMSGGAFAQATVFAMGIQPYINSSIIIQLLTVAIPALERLAKEGGVHLPGELQPGLVLFEQLGVGHGVQPNPAIGPAGILQPRGAGEEGQAQLRNEQLLGPVREEGGGAQDHIVPRRHTSGGQGREHPRPQAIGILKLIDFAAQNVHCLKPAG